MITIIERRIAKRESEIRILRENIQIILDEIQRLKEKMRQMLRSITFDYIVTREPELIDQYVKLCKEYDVISVFI